MSQDGLTFHVSLLWPGARVSRAWSVSRAGVYRFLGEERHRRDRPSSPRSDRPLSGC